MRFIDRRRLKERGLYSHNCNKLNKTNMLSAKISREFKNSGISIPSIDTSGPSRDDIAVFQIPTTMSKSSLRVTVLLSFSILA